MSEYVPSVGAARARYCDSIVRKDGVPHSFVVAPGEHAKNHAEFDRMIAEVERAAAVKALTEAAEQFATQDGIENLMFAHDDVSAVEATEKWLIDRAAALGLTAGQEGEQA